MSAEVALLRLATRGSALALAQAMLVAGLLERAEPGTKVELVRVRTSGDERPAKEPGGFGARGRRVASDSGGLDGTSPAGEPLDKSRFVKEIEEALLANEADLAIHSAKDVPSELPEGLAIVGVPARADARDAICGADSLAALPPGARVGTSSLRRRAQLLASRDDLEVVDLSGNVDTRLHRLSAGDFEAVLLALAGLERLGRSEGAPVEPADMTPAPGQGCLALEARVGDEPVAELAARVTDREALVCLTAERAVTVELAATCRTPIGVHAALGTPTPNALTISTFVGLPDGSAWIRDRVRGDAKSPSELGREAARRVRSVGASELLSAAETDAGRSFPTARS